MASASDLAGDSLLYADPGTLRRMRDELVAEQYRIVWRYHPHYRRIFEAAGLGVDDVNGLADLPRLPVTTKAAFLRDPESFRLTLPARMPLEDRTLAYLIYTTGTTSGVPAPLYVTTSDDWAFLLHAGRCARMVGLSNRDVIANLFPLTPFPMGARIRADRTAAAVGATIFQGHTGRESSRWPVHRRLDEALDLVVAHRATTLWGIAGFIRRLLIRAAERDIALPTVRWCFVTGEASSDAGLADLRRRLDAVGAGAAKVVNRYGSTEGWTMIGCAEGQGWHNPSPEMLYFEVADPDTGRPLPDGEAGALLVSHLRARGTAFVRYALGDVVRLTREPCPACGRTCERVVSQPVRTGDLLKVNGTLVNVAALSDALLLTPGVAEHRVVVEDVRPDDPQSGDVLVVEVAVAGQSPEPVVAAVGARVRGLVHVTPQVRVVTADEIYEPATDAKPRRLVDRRRAGRERGNR